MGVDQPYVLPNYWREHGVDNQEPASGTLRLLNEYVDRQVAAGEPAMLIDAGDLAYARGDATLWDYYMHSLESIASRAPVMVAPGNQYVNVTSLVND